MNRPVRRGFVVLLPYALAVAIAYGMVASALAIPLAHAGAATRAAAGDVAGHETDCPTDSDPVARVATVPRTAAEPGPRRPRPRDPDLHAGHALAAPRATVPRGTARPDRDEDGPSDHFDCCTTRLGTVGTPALALAAVQRRATENRRRRAPALRMPSRPRPWRVSLGRQPPAAAGGRAPAAA